MKTKLRVALCQLTSTDNPTENLKAILSHIDRGLQQKAEVFFFPENSLYFRIEKGPIEFSFDENSKEVLELDQKAQAEKIDIFLGSLPWREGGKIRNATLWFSPSKKPQIVYRKMHLFDVDVEGHKPVRESDDFLAGDESRVLDFKGWKIGLSICYDLRFAELYSIYAKAAVDLILIPSAFLVPTGEAHWHILNRARAIETQAFVISAAQGGTHEGSRGSRRSTFGHSLAIDPWGRVLAESRSSNETPVIELDPEAIDRVRAQIPMKAHRKLKV